MMLFRSTLFPPVKSDVTCEGHIPRKYDRPVGFEKTPDNAEERYYSRDLGLTLKRDDDGITWHVVNDCYQEISSQSTTSTSTIQKYPYEYEYEFMFEYVEAVAGYNCASFPTVTLRYYPDQLGCNWGIKDCNSLPFRWLIPPSDSVSVSASVKPSVSASAPVRNSGGLPP